ncbi:MAG: acylphosphatase [Candidatus Omnitrophica bacterium]|nr:acylphosphatase [Candidatus Omnitrophota bacterium]
MIKRAEITYSGNVQGVGFRFAARNIAGMFHEISGYVENMSDGSVSVVCEGEQKTVERFIVAIELEMAGYIRDVKVLWSDPTGEFNGFKIRH